MLKFECTHPRLRNKNTMEKHITNKSTKTERWTNRILEEQRSRILEELNRRPNRARMEAWTQRMSGVSVEDAMRLVENLNETHEGFTKNALIRHLVEKCRA